MLLLCSYLSIVIASGNWHQESDLHDRKTAGLQDIIYKLGINRYYDITDCL
jgi:hypothetical protein